MLATIVLLKKWKYAPSKSRNGGNMSAIIMLHMKWKYALAESRKWWEHKKWREYVSNDCAAYEIEMRTF